MGGGPISGLDPTGLQFIPFPGGSPGFWPLPPCRNKSTTPKTPLSTIKVPIPKNDPGCSGWCFSVQGTTILNAKITLDSIREVGDGCPWVLETLLKVPGTIASELGKQITPQTTYTMDNCSGDGCSCKDRTRYDGKTISLDFTKQEIELDPSGFLPPLNSFKKGECFVVVSGAIDMIVGKGWVGRCAK